MEPWIIVAAGICGVALIVALVWIDLRKRHRAVQKQRPAVKVVLSDQGKIDLDKATKAFADGMKTMEKGGVKFKK